MNRFLLFFSFLLFLFTTSFAQEHIDNWNFSSITNTDGKELISVSSEDYMHINSDGTFQYELAAKNNLLASGTWTFQDESLCFQYTAPKDTLRCYSISNLTGSSVTLKEGSVYFNFKKDIDNQVLSTPLPKSGESRLWSIIRGIIGLFVLLIIAYLCSGNRKNINWPLVGKGLLIQFIFAIGILKVPFIESIFEAVSNGFITVISFTQAGTDFLFASFVTGRIEAPLINFIVQVLPTIIFFAALTSLFYYYGILQKIVYAFAWIMKRFMKLSGAESLAAAGNIFLGQTESPLLVRPYLDKMTRSEMLCLMSGGMATIAGGVLAAYIGFLGGDDPVQQLLFAKHLLAASVMSAPAAIVAAKILLPETEEFNQKMELSKERLGSNALEAISNGTTDGLRLAVNVGAMLLVFTALIAMGNYITMDLIGDWTGLNDWIAANTAYDGLTLQFMVGYLFAPIAWLMGIAWEDAVLVGQLLGEKTILNEFYAYKTLGEMKASGLFHYQKSVVMATYILCGFANFASIGIQIGGIGALVPKRRALLSELGIRALIAGTLACMFTAVIVGMLL